MSLLTYSALLPDSPSPQLQVVLKLIESGSVFNTKVFAENVTEDYMHYYLPESAKLPTFTKAEFIGRLEFMKNMFAELKVDVKEIIEAAGVVVVYMTTNVATRGGNVTNPEVVNIVYVAGQPDGSYKATKTKEYLDTVKFAAFESAVQREMAQARA